MKKVAIGIVAVLVLILAAVAILPAVIDWNGFKPRIEAAVRESTGRSLTIDGDLSVSLLPRIAFSAAGVKFGNAPGAEPAQMATVERIEGEIALLPLLGRNVVVERLLVERPAVDLQVDAQGNPNWMFTPEGTTDEPTVDSGDGEGFSGDIRIEDAQIVDGRVTYTDARTGQKIDAGEIQATLSAPGLSEVAAFDAAMTVNGDAVRSRFSLDTPRRLLDGEKATAVFALDAPKAKAGYEGGVQAKPVPGLDGTFDLDIPSVGTLVAWLGRPLPKGQPDPGPVKARAVFTADGPRMALTEAVLEGTDLNAKASGSVDLSGPAPKVALVVESGILNIDRYLPPAAAEPLKAPAPKPKAAGNFLDTLSDEAFDLEMLRQGQADIRVNMEGIRALGFVVGSTAFAATLQDGKLNADLSRLQLYGGSIRARTTLDAAGKALALTANGTVDKVDVGKLAQAAAPAGQAPVAGVVSATLEANGSGTSVRTLAESLKGRLTADLGGMNVRDAAAGALSGLKLDLTLPGMNGQPTLAANFVYNREQVEVEAQTAPLAQVVAEDRFNLDASVRSAPLTASYSGAVVKAPGPGLDGKADLDIASIGRLAAWLGQPLDAKQPDPGPLKLAATFATEGPRVVLRESTIEGKALRASAEGSIDTTVSPRRFAATVTVHEADLDAYLPPDSGAKADGRPPGQPVANTGWSDDPIELGALRENSGEVTVALNDVRYRGLVVEQGRLTAAVKDGSLKAALSDMRTAGGSIGGEVTLADTGQGVRIAWDANASGLAARPLLTAFAGSDRLSGTAAFSAKGTGAGRSQKALISSLDGDGSFEFRDGAIHGINIAAALRQVTTAGLGNAAEQKTDFAELSGTFTIRQGIVENRDLKMLAPLLRLGGGGTVSLPQQSLDYTVDATLVASLKGQGGRDDLAGIPVPIRITGAWSNPRWDIQWDRLLQGLANDPERLKNLPGSLQDLAKGAGIQIPGVAIPGIGGSGGAGGLRDVLPGAGQSGGAKPGADLLRGLLGGGKASPTQPPAGQAAPATPEREPAPGPRPLREPQPEQRQPAEPQQMLRGLFGR